MTHSADEYLSSVISGFQDKDPDLVQSSIEHGQIDEIPFSRVYCKMASESQSTNSLAHVLLYQSTGSSGSLGVIAQDYEPYNKATLDLMEASLLTLHKDINTIALPSIVGKWVGQIPASNGQFAIMNVEFKADGTEIQTIQAPGQNIFIQATYTINNNLLSETLVSGTKNGITTQNPNQTEKFRYDIDGDVLSLSQENNPDPLQLRRLGE